jgi:7,8-dihydropterin-6-yl-methyl-4-(beta-D-ribofuranosyl)aminobenzene 5'-phosphate synthase
MITDLRITVLVDDIARDPDLLAEHGLSFWIEADGHSILFDTGQGQALNANAGRLGVDLERADAVVLSHGHYDHTGGLAELPSLGPESTVYLHPLALQAKYARTTAPPHKAIGIPDRAGTRLLSSGCRLVDTRSPTEVSPGVFVTGQIPRRTPFEDPGGPFFLDEKCTQTDLLLDDQALCIESQAGLVVVVGCAHSGVVNTMDYVAKLTGKPSIHAILGGMHLAHASEDRIAQTAAAFDRRPIRMVAPCHCTGDRPVAELRNLLGARVVESFTGASFTLSTGSADT